MWALGKSQWVVLVHETMWKQRKHLLGHIKTLNVHSTSPPPHTHINTKTQQGTVLFVKSWFLESHLLLGCIKTFKEKTKTHWPHTSITGPPPTVFQLTCQNATDTNTNIYSHRIAAKPPSRSHIDWCTFTCMIMTFTEDAVVSERDDVADLKKRNRVPESPKKNTRVKHFLLYCLRGHSFKCLILLWMLGAFNCLLSRSFYGHSLSVWCCLCKSLSPY